MTNSIKSEFGFGGKEDEQNRHGSCVKWEGRQDKALQRSWSANEVDKGGLMQPGRSSLEPDSCGTLEGNC